MYHSLRQEYLISYDIGDNRKREQLRKELCKYGLKAVQKSVFWGYLTVAEIKTIQRYLIKCITGYDRAFITHTNFNGRGNSFFVGHHETDFLDWKEYEVV